MAGYGSGRYTAAFTHPDPLDPNDRVRQKTHSRSKEFPYDRPVRYGEPESQAMDGSKYQDGGYGGQLTPWFMPGDEGDESRVEVDEASETPYLFGRSTMDIRSGNEPHGSLRSFAGAHKDNLDVEPNEVFGEDTVVSLKDLLRDLVQDKIDDLLDVGDEDQWPEMVRIRQFQALEGLNELEGEVDLSFVEDLRLGECFAVHNPDGSEVVSLLERLDWER